MKLEAEKTAKKNAKELEKLKNENVKLVDKKTKLKSRIEFLQQPARTPEETKNVLVEVFQNFKDLKSSYDKRLLELNKYTKDENTAIKNALILDIETEGNKLNDIAHEVEILFTAHANKCKDEKVIALRKEIYTLWQDARMLGYDLTLSRIQLSKAMQLIDIETNFNETKTRYEGQLKELSVPRSEMPGVASFTSGYYVDTQKLGAYEKFLTDVRTKFDEINKVAFKGEKTLINFHATFKPLEDKTEGVRKIAVDNIEQANINENKSNQIRNECENKLKSIYAKSITAWAELKKIQTAVHEEVAILESAWKSDSKGLPTILGGTLDEAKKLKYEPAAIY
jgi:hypothetical protein